MLKGEGSVGWRGRGQYVGGGEVSRLVCEDCLKVAHAGEMVNTFNQSDSCTVTVIS